MGPLESLARRRREEDPADTLVHLAEVIDGDFAWVRQRFEVRDLTAKESPMQRADEIRKLRAENEGLRKELEDERALCERLREARENWREKWKSTDRTLTQALKSREALLKARLEAARHARDDALRKLRQIKGLIVHEEDPCPES